MLDPDEMAEYEAWKMNKMVGQVDISVQAYNAEMEATALAYEAGVRDMERYRDALEKGETVDYPANPYRKPGMRGERRAVAQVSGNTTTQPAE